MIEKFTTEISINTKGEALSEQEVMDNRSSAYDFIDVDKQETLEEAAEKYIKEYDVENYISIEDFIIGAKWQQERSYSEEDLRNAFTEGHDSARMKGSYKSNGTFEEDWILWFEQFKRNNMKETIEEGDEIITTTKFSWQHERMYSEEEVLELLKKFAPHIRYNHKELPHTWEQVVKEWFERNKKK